MEKVSSVFIKYSVITVLSAIVILLTNISSVYGDLITDNTLNTYGFIENKGQFVDENGKIVHSIEYVSNNKLKSIYIRETGISFVNLKPTADTNIYDVEIQEMNFADCNLNIEIAGLERSSDYINYYLPQCPDGILNVYKYTKIEYKNIYDNIDFQFYLNDNGSLQYDFIVNPGGDPSEIRLQMYNVDSLILDDYGIYVRSQSNEIHHSHPFSYQVFGNEKSEINSSFNINNDNTITFSVSEYDSTKQLRIDPVIREWGTFFGGEYEDELRDISFDSNNNIIACGFSSSEYDIATTSSYQKNLNGFADAIIIKMDSSGNRLWSTYYGGSELDMGAYIAIDSNDDIIISGSTLSNDVIGNGGYQANNNGSYDCFLAKFNSSGYRLWGTFYGGNKEDNPYVAVGITYGKIVLDDNSNIYLSGISSSDNVIGVGGWQSYIGSVNMYDCFLAKFDSNGNRVWGTYYGGSGNDWLHDMELDNEGNLIIGGATASTDTFASEDAWQNVGIMLGLPMFLAKFNSTNGVRVWGTYFYEENYSTQLNNLDVDSAGNVYFVAMSDSRNLGIGNNIGILLPGYDYLIGKFTNGGKPVWTSYIGGSGYDYPTKIIIGDNDEHFYVSGITQSSDFPVRAPYQKELRGWRDPVLLKYDTKGRYIWGTYYGGYSDIEENINDVVWSFDYNEDHQIVMAGRTSSVEVFGFGGFQENYGGGDIDSWIGSFDEFKITCGEPYPTSVCPESEISLPFSMNKNLDENIKIDAFLWDANGNYFDSIIIGSINAKTSGIVEATIPKSLPPGNYFVSILGAENFFPININPLPIPQIIGAEYVCSQNTMGFTCNLQDDFSYEWSAKKGIIVGDDNLRTMNIYWNESGRDTIAVKVTNIITGCSNTTEMEIQIDLWDSEISGKKLVCYGESHQIYYNNIMGLQKRWSVSGGKILSGQNTDSISVNWTSTGENQVELILTNPNGGCSDTVSINVTVDEYQIPDPTIFGRLAVCPNELQEYFVVSNGVNNYEWHVTGGEIVENEPANNIVVKWSEEAEAGISVIERTPAGCSGTDDRKIYINCFGAEIYGNDMVCVGGVYQYSTQNIIGTSNIWTAKPGGEVISGRLLDTVNVRWTQGGTKILGLTKVTQTQFGNCTKIFTKLIDNSYEISVFDIPEIEYDPKDQYETTMSIPILIEKPGCIRYMGEETTVTAKVRLKKSLFLPLTNSSQQYQDDENDIWRTITIQQQILNNEESSVLLYISGYALLGDTLGTPIIIESLEFGGIEIDYLTKNGSLKLININDWGGKRLLRKQRMELLKIFPVPFDNEVNLMIDSREEADVRIELYSVLGEKVFSENMILEGGVQEKEIKLSKRLSDGVYRIVLRDGDYILSENVIIKN
jgi:hypothetical protein